MSVFFLSSLLAAFYEFPQLTPQIVNIRNLMLEKMTRTHWVFPHSFHDSDQIGSQQATCSRGQGRVRSLVFFDNQDVPDG